MRNHKAKKEDVKPNEQFTLYSQVNRTDTAALICDVFLLCVFIIDQIFYGLDMWFVILPLVLIGLYLLLFGVFPEKYIFTRESLDICNLVYKTASIPYKNVFNMEATGKDGFVNLLRQNKVKVYYTSGNSKKLSVCRPRNVDEFTDKLKKRCHEFDDDWQDTDLKVFFKK